MLQRQIRRSTVALARKSRFDGPHIPPLFARNLCMTLGGGGAEIAPQKIAVAVESGRNI